MVIQYHDTLHEFRALRGTGTTSLEANMIQQPIDMRQEVLYEIFLDLHKAFNVIDRSLCIFILV